MFAPGALTSGLSAWPNGVRPPAEKLVGTPAQVVSTSSQLAREPDLGLAARSGHGGPETRAVEVGDRTTLSGEQAQTRDRRRGPRRRPSRSRLRSRPRSNFPRIRATAPAHERDGAAQRVGGKRRAVPAEQPAHARERADVDESLVGVHPRRRHAARRHERDAPERDRRRDDDHGRVEDVRVRGRADADRVRRGRGRAGGPEPEEVAVVTGRDDRDDAGVDDVPDRLHHRVGARVGLRACRPRS